MTIYRLIKRPLLGFRRVCPYGKMVGPADFAQPFLHLFNSGSCSRDKAMRENISDCVPTAGSGCFDQFDGLGKSHKPLHQVVPKVFGKFIQEDVQVSLTNGIPRWRGNPEIGFLF